MSSRVVTSQAMTAVAGQRKEGRKSSNSVNGVTIAVIMPAGTFTKGEIGDKR
jgi:hypothetical protein